MKTYGYAYWKMFSVAALTLISQTLVIKFSTDAEHLCQVREDLVPFEKSQRAQRTNQPTNQ